MYRVEVYCPLLLRVLRRERRAAGEGCCTVDPEVEGVGDAPSEVEVDETPSEVWGAPSDTGGTLAVVDGTDRCST